MLRNKKILLALLAVVLTIVFSSFRITAQNSGKNKNYGNNDPTVWNNSNVPQKYWLSENQINKIKDIQNNYDGRIQPQIDKLNNLREESFNYSKKDNAEYTKVTDYHNQINRLEEQIYNIRLEARNKISNVLAKNQRHYYRDYCFNNWWTWKMDGSCSWDMDRYMTDNSSHSWGMNYNGDCCR